MTAPSPAAASNAVALIKTEHRALACVLGAMQALIARWREPGAEPDHALFDAMLRYVENVPDRLHHPKEDRVLFPAVAGLAGGQALVAELERDHARGAGMLAELRRAQRVLRDGGANGLNQLSTAVDDFVEFYWSHMRKEEQQLLPFALAKLPAAEWDGIARAFGDNADPLFGQPLAEEYRRLYRLIAELAPGPLKSLLEGAAPAAAP